MDRFNPSSDPTDQRGRRDQQEMPADQQETRVLPDQSDPPVQREGVQLVPPETLAQEVRAVAPLEILALQEIQAQRDRQVSEVLARLALLVLAPPALQALELPVLRGAMARLVQQVPPASQAHKVLVDQWAQRAVPVLKACRAAGDPQEQRAITEAQERWALRDQAAHKGLKE